MTFTTYKHNLILTFQMKPSQFLFQMSMDTEKKLANMHTMNVPRKVELLDMADTTHQKVYHYFDSYVLDIQLTNNLQHT